MQDLEKINDKEASHSSLRVNKQAALEIEGLRQVIGLPGTKETFTLNVPERISISGGEFVGILGQTGCGKTTLLSVLGLLRGATPGSSLKKFSMVFRGGAGPTDLTEVWRQNRLSMANRLRRAHFGFALQHGELLPSLTVAENIAFPLRLNGWSRKRIQSRVEYLIDAFRLYRSFQNSEDEQVETPEMNPGNSGAQLSSLAATRINRLSGGQYQRVALARAVAHQPEFLFVDEPTASLNRSVARIALTQLSNLRTEDGFRTTILMVTHDELFANEFCNRIIQMRPVSLNGSSSGNAAGEVMFGNQSPDTSP